MIDLSSLTPPFQVIIWAMAIAFAYYILNKVGFISYIDNLPKIIGTEVRDTIETLKGGEFKPTTINFLCVLAVTIIGGLLLYLGVFRNTFLSELIGLRKLEALPQVQTSFMETIICIIIYALVIILTLIASGIAVRTMNDE